MPKNPSHTLTLKARAKVNLTLEVLGRREDGYHDIVSIIQTIDLCDTLTLEPADAISLECDKPELQSPDNLVLKAAYLLKASTGYDWGVRITLMKGIPISAGLGGGSSDAAATLTGLNTLWGLGQSLDELSALAAQLGSDVPFFLHGGTAMVQGKGERVRIMSPAVLPRKDEWLVILKPDIEVEQKTASLYGRLTDANFTRGALTRKLEARINGGGDTPPQFLFNAFDDVAYEAFPGLESYWNTLYSLGAREIHLAGSGPSLFAPVSRKEVGTALHLMLKHQHGMEAYLASTWHPAEEAQK
jgi:4-diphosphocytidyl-2-C-methyl-D-erythritol kinase